MEITVEPLIVTNVFLITCFTFRTRQRVPSFLFQLNLILDYHTDLVQRLHVITTITLKILMYMFNADNA